MTTFIIVDAQSVKNTDSAEEKGYDAGKKVSGIKRHIAVDTQGLPHAVAVTTADVADRNGALAAIDRCKPKSGVSRKPAGRWRLHGPTLCRRRDRAVEGNGASGQAQRTAYVCRAAETLDCRALLRMVGKVPKTVEELRTQTQYQLAVRSPRLPRAPTQKIVNRL